MSAIVFVLIRACPDDTALEYSSASAGSAVNSTCEYSLARSIASVVLMRVFALPYCCAIYRVFLLTQCQYVYVTLHSLAG